MVVEIASMAIGASTPIATIDRGIAVAVCPNFPGAIDIGMAEEATVFVDDGDRVTDVAVDAEGGAGDGRRVVMAMAGGQSEIVDTVTTDTL